jgi:U3 small nucleolar RNA-associated protein 3
LIDFYQENDVNSDELQDVEVLDPDQDYYNAVKEDAINRKLARKKERAELYNQLNEPMDVLQEESLDPEEKRKATYKILANRGLTPYRKKENRNPRVKKRIKYDGAIKKLKSVRRVAVDKSKIGKYQGETTGIKNNLTRSVRF